MENLLFVPPVAFLVLLGAAWLQNWSLRPLALKPAVSDKPTGKYKSYACGEDVADHRSQPDFSQFFPFAFFFTVMHVLALVVATIPKGSLAAAGLGVLFLVCAAVGLSVLYRR